MRRCPETLNTVMSAGSCTRKWPPGIFFKGSSEELKLNLGQHQHMEEAFISLNFNWTESGLFFIPLPPFSINTGNPREISLWSSEKRNQEWPFGVAWPPGGTPTTRARVFGNLRHYYKLWSSLGWEKCWENVEKVSIDGSAKNKHKFVMVLWQSLAWGLLSWYITVLNIIEWSWLLG